MSVHVQPEDVQARYLNGEIPEGWLELQIEDAEQLLFSIVPRLEFSATDRDIVNIKRVVSTAIIRFFDNPRGMRTEQVEEQSWSLASGADTETAGKLHFTASDLKVFRQSVKRIGSIGVAPAWPSGYGAT